MTATQLSFLAANDSGCEATGDWAHDEEGLGTKIYLVPKLKINNLGTKEDPPDRTIKLVPKIYQPSIGCLQQKMINGQLYWYWRYYDASGKKKSKYLAKDYSDAVAKTKLIGWPDDAKQPKPSPIATPRTKAPTLRPKTCPRAAWIAHFGRLPRRES